MHGALKIDLVLGQGMVFALGASLLVLKGFAAALVAFVVDLEMRCQQERLNNTDCI